MIVDSIRKEGCYERVSKELINLSKEGDIKDLHNDIKYHSKYHIKYKYHITLSIILNVQGGLHSTSIFKQCIFCLPKTIESI
jgi:hypothetical protein